MKRCRAWRTADVAATPAGTPLVTFNHIPCIGGGVTVGPARGRRCTLRDRNRRPRLLSALGLQPSGPAGYWERDVVRDFKAPLEGDPCFVVTVLPMHKDQLIAVRVAA
jgi:hypothetical protein